MHSISGVKSTPKPEFLSPREEYERSLEQVKMKLLGGSKAVGKKVGSLKKRLEMGLYTKAAEARERERPMDARDEKCQKGAKDSIQHSLGQPEWNDRHSVLPSSNNAERHAYYRSYFDRNCEFHPEYPTEAMTWSQTRLV